MALYWTGKPHDTPDLAKNLRDYEAITRVSLVARDAVWRGEIRLLADAVRQSHAAQCSEGMPLLNGRSAGLPPTIVPLAAKYCGGGFGGYAVFLFAEPAERDAACTHAGFRAVEPYLNIG